MLGVFGVHLSIRRAKKKEKEETVVFIRSAHVQQLEISLTKVPIHLFYSIFVQ
jgi:hypothetical protein